METTALSATPPVNGLTSLTLLAPALRLCATIVACVGTSERAIVKSSQTVANEFLKLAREANEALTLMQVLKLVYIAHGWMLALHRRPLLRDEIQAWQHGPVIPELYDLVRKFRGGPVDELEPAQGEKLDSCETELVRRVFARYRRFNGLELSSMTHAEHSPWALIYNGKNFGEVIPDDLIKAHYARVVDEQPL